MVSCMIFKASVWKLLDLPMYTGRKMQNMNVKFPTHTIKCVPLVELILRETNIYAAQKIQARSFIPLRSRVRDWKPVSKDEMHVVLALFMLMGIIQKHAPKCFTVTESHGEECKGIEGQDEEGITKRETNTHEKNAEHECKISQAHNKMCTTVRGLSGKHPAILNISRTCRVTLM